MEREKKTTYDMQKSSSDLRKKAVSTEQRDKREISDV